MSSDKSAKEKLSEALWVALLCKCECCGNILMLEEIEYLQDINTMQWADAAADPAFTLGRRSVDGAIQCNKCVAKSPSPLPRSQQGNDA